MAHLTVHVADIEKSIKFYEDVLGFSVQQDMRGGAMAIVFMAAEPGDVQIELIGDAAPFAGGNISAGFTVPDLEAAHERMKKLPYQVTDMVSPNPHVSFFFVTDPDGFQIQICPEGLH